MAELLPFNDWSQHEIFEQLACHNWAKNRKKGAEKLFGRGSLLKGQAGSHFFLDRGDMGCPLFPEKMGLSLMN